MSKNEAAACLIGGRQINSPESLTGKPLTGNSLQIVSGRNAKRLRQLLLVAALSGALIAVPQMAQAADHTPSGARASTYSVGPEQNPNVIPESDFNVNTTSGDAVSITGTGEIIYNAQYSTNTLVTTVGAGLRIVNNGDISGGNIGSINVISEASITGGSYGIYAFNDGTGDTSITASGDVVGTNYQGIFANNDTGARDLTVDAKNVTGGNYGIYTNNAGAGVFTAVPNVPVLVPFIRTTLALATPILQ